MGETMYRLSTDCELADQDRIPSLTDAKTQAWRTVKAGQCARVDVIWIGPAECIVWRVERTRWGVRQGLPVEEEGSS